MGGEVLSCQESTAGPASQCLFSHFESNHVSEQGEGEKTLNSSKYSHFFEVEDRRETDPSFKSGYESRNICSH